MKTKSQLRKEFRAICARITPAERLLAAKAAADRFVREACFQRSEHIACYLSLQGEFDCAPIIEAIWQAKKACYVPVLSAGKEYHLQFARYQYGDALHLNRYAILEPVNKTDEIVPEKLDLVLVPLVAFDQQGHRLGTGGGYYDRTFAFLQTHPSVKPLMLGIAYAAQATDLLPADPWDIRLDGVVTEQGVVDCR